MTFPVYFWIGLWRIHPHLLFESLAYAIAFRLVLLNVRQDAIAPTQRSSVMVGGTIGALVGAKVLVLLQHINLAWENWQQLFLLLLRGKTTELQQHYLEISPDDRFDRLTDYQLL